jgi:hypothetical protein
MFVTVIRPFLIKGGVAQEGDRVDLPEQRVRDLEVNGLVTRDVVGQTVSREKPTGTEPDPMTPRPTGGQTGAASPVSSSLADPLPAKRRWPRRKAVAAS